MIFRLRKSIANFWNRSDASPSIWLLMNCIPWSRLSDELLELVETLMNCVWCLFKISVTFRSKHFSGRQKLHMHELFPLGYFSIRKNMTFLWWGHHPTHRFDYYYIETLRFRTTRWSCTCFKFLRSLNSEHPCHNFEQIIAKQLWDCTKSPHHVHQCPVVSILVRNIKLQCRLEICQNIYTTKFSCVRILHIENA